MGLKETIAKAMGLSVIDTATAAKEEQTIDWVQELSAAELKKIGVTVTDAGDQTVVKPVDSEVDKMVDALLKAAAGEEGDA